MLPRRQRQPILEAAAALAETDYRENKELTAFDAFIKESEADTDLTLDEHV